MMYADPKQEAESLMAWMDRRFEWPTTARLYAMYIRSFQKMWRESFGSLDDVPKEYKEKLMTRYEELKERDGREGNEHQQGDGASKVVQSVSVCGPAV